MYPLSSSLIHLIHRKRSIPLPPDGGTLAVDALAGSRSLLLPNTALAGSTTTKRKILHNLRMTTTPVRSGHWPLPFAVDSRDNKL